MRTAEHVSSNDNNNPFTPQSRSVGGAAVKSRDIVLPDMRDEEKPYDVLDELYELRGGNKKMAIFFITDDDIPVKASSDGEGHVEVKNVLTGRDKNLADILFHAFVVSEDEFNRFVSSCRASA